MYQVLKSAPAVKSLTEADLAAINALTRTPLTDEEVYTFSVRACDDLPDRDNERFDAECVKALAELYVGKPMLFDHSWSAHEQTARIYKAESVDEDGATCLVVSAYLLRIPETECLIAAIDGGILKEVSVGCAVDSVTCNICGGSYYSCEHRKGGVYSGEKCVPVLSGPTDAYEISFVAVPAQPLAGVRKRAGRENMSIGAAERAKARLLLEKIRFGG